MTDKFNIEELLNFCVKLSRHMIVSGANIERVQLAAAFICKAYELQDISIYILSTHILLSATDKDGHYASRQASIPPSGIHLERLRSLNQLSYKVAEITPPTKLLAKMLDKALNVKTYSNHVVLLGRIAAMSSLCFIFGGSFSELLPVAAVTALIHYLLALLEKTGLDRIVINSLTMFIASALAIMFVFSGFSSNFPVILISISMLVIPGIPLVNAMRNLLCGHEINGILQMIKIFIETMALAMGIYSAFALMGSYINIGGSGIASLSNPALLVIFSFTASLSFGVVFNVAPKDLWLSGLSGALTRIALIFLTPVLSSRLAYMTLSALLAALGAEFLAVRRREPSTYFLYPAIIPLIPGDLFFFALSGLYLGNREIVEVNGINCLLSLAGMCIGFVLSSTVAHYARRVRYYRT